MVYIGIDPGKSGGYATINTLTGKMTVEAWDDEQFIHDMRELYLDGEETRCCLEKVGAMPGQGVTSMFGFGKSAGFIEGVLRAYGISYQLVPPQTWKKAFSLNSNKQTSIEVCQKLFPDVNLYRTDRCKKPHDGMAESALMALYARRKL
jgi:crossover junction endodeoxyribonuclease RuvC